MRRFLLITCMFMIMTGCSEKNEYPSESETPEIVEITEVKHDFLVEPIDLEPLYNQISLTDSQKVLLSGFASDGDQFYFYTTDTTQGELYGQDRFMGVYGYNIQTKEVTSYLIEPPQDYQVISNVVVLNGTAYYITMQLDLDYTKEIFNYNVYKVVDGIPTTIFTGQVPTVLRMPNLKRSGDNLVFVGENILVTDANAIQYCRTIAIYDGTSLDESNQFCEEGPSLDQIPSYRENNPWNLFTSGRGFTYHSTNESASTIYYFIGNQLEKQLDLPYLTVNSLIINEKLGYYYYVADEDRFYLALNDVETDETTTYAMHRNIIMTPIWQNTSSIVVNPRVAFEEMFSNKAAGSDIDNYRQYLIQEIDGFLTFSKIGGEQALSNGYWHYFQLDSRRGVMYQYETENMEIKAFEITIKEE